MNGEKDCRKQPFPRRTPFFAKPQDVGRRARVLPPRVTSEFRVRDPPREFRPPRIRLPHKNFSCRRNLASERKTAPIGPRVRKLGAWGKLGAGEKCRQTAPERTPVPPSGGQFFFGATPTLPQRSTLATSQNLDIRRVVRRKPLGRTVRNV